MSHSTRFFGLDVRPFDPHGQQSPVMGTPALKSAFARISSALDDGAKVLLVAGPEGVGKSSLARVLPRLLDGSRRISLIQARGSQEPESVLDAILEAPAPHPDETHSPLLIVDDAEDLPAGSLKKLGDVVSNKEAASPLSCILIVTSPTQNADSRSTIPDDIVNMSSEQVVLEPLSGADTRRYVQRHMERAGGVSDDLFSESVLDAIHRLTGGLPREVSHLCEQLLEIAAERQVKAIDPEWLEQLPGQNCEPDSDSGSSFDWPTPGSLSDPEHSRSHPPATESPRPETEMVASLEEEPGPQISLQREEPGMKWSHKLALAAAVALAGSLAIVMLNPWHPAAAVPDEPNAPTVPMTQKPAETQTRPPNLQSSSPSHEIEPFEPIKAAQLTISSSAGPIQLTAPQSSRKMAIRSPQPLAQWTELNHVKLVLEDMADWVPDTPSDPMEPEGP